MGTTSSENNPAVQKREGAGEHIRINYVAVKAAAMTMRAINQKVRQQIIKLLEEHKRLMVTEIYVRLRLEQSMASQHLAILRHARIITPERDGKQIYYTLNYARIAEVASFLNKMA